MFGFDFSSIADSWILWREMLLARWKTGTLFSLFVFLQPTLLLSKLSIVNFHCSSNDPDFVDIETFLAGDLNSNCGFSSN